MNIVFKVFGVTRHGNEGRSTDRKVDAKTLYHRATIVTAIGCDTKHLDKILCRPLSFEVHCQRKSGITYP